jgi:hypothetical protein
MLEVSESPLDEVTLGGQTQYVSRGQGETLAAVLWEASDAQQRSLAAHEEAVERRRVWEADRERWFGNVTQRRGRGRLTERGPKVELTELTYPDGGQVQVAVGSERDHVFAAFEKRRPKPAVPEQVSWRNAVTVRPVPGWRGALVDVSGERRDVFVSHERTLAVLKALDELAGQGWGIAHVSEDRQMFSGYRSGVTRGRYLLARS